MKQKENKIDKKNCLHFINYYYFLLLSYLDICTICFTDPVRSILQFNIQNANYLFGPFAPNNILFYFIRLSPQFILF